MKVLKFKRNAVRIFPEKRNNARMLKQAGGNVTSLAENIRKIFRSIS